MYPSARQLLIPWVRYQFGVFDETGFQNDEVYPAEYLHGNAILASNGCLDVPEEPFCPFGGYYDPNAPTKQNLLCFGTSAIEHVIILIFLWLTPHFPDFRSRPKIKHPKTSTRLNSATLNKEKGIITCWCWIVEAYPRVGGIKSGNPSISSYPSFRKGRSWPS